jgi:uncharacterized membrane protein
MKPQTYTVPDEAPVWVKNVLSGSPSRRSLQVLIVLCLITAIMVAWALRGRPGALLALLFLGYAGLAAVALQWAERNKLFR